MELEEHGCKGDQAGFYKHLKGLNLEGAGKCSSQVIRDESVQLLRDPTD